MLKILFILFFLFSCECIQIKRHKYEPNNTSITTVDQKKKSFDANTVYTSNEAHEISIVFSIFNNPLNGCSFLKIKSLETSKGNFIEVFSPSYCSTYNVTINGKQYSSEFGLSDSEIYFVPTSGKYKVCANFNCTTAPCCQDVQLK